ncbi:MAG: adenylate/guanylate cyclase domain-containing protein [Elusimicrobiota bacterium]|nr:adenylate/guanylate cyclase domain-containing protein [Elusimicrobiota bacterium]
MKIKVNKIALKLSIFASLFVLGIIAAMTWILLQQGEQLMISEMKLRSIAYARSAGEAISPQLDIFTLHFNTQEMLKEKGVEYAVILDAGSKILSHTDSQKIGGIDAGPVARLASEARTPLVQQYSSHGVSYFDISAPVFSGNRRTGTVHIGSTQAAVASSLKDAKQKVLVIAGFAIILDMLGTILIVGWMLRPLPVLARAARAVGEGRLDMQIGFTMKDEIGQLTEAFNQMVVSLREKEMIRNTFGRYMSKEVVDGFLNGKVSLELGGGELKEMTVLMSDIRGFTEFSEKLPPQEVVHLLNRYFTEMVQAIGANGGTVDKFIGDAILAVFGWPMPRQDHEKLAVDAALDMKARLAVLNTSLIKEGRKPIAIGIAINSGKAVAGNIGSQEKVQYTVIGDAVNVASRMESANKDYGTDLIVSQPVYLATKNYFKFKDIGEKPVRGRTEPVHIYQVLGHKLNRQA